MPTYNCGKRFLFVHIPRTAGRFLEENFKENGFELEQGYIWDSVDGIEVAHFHRELYEKHLDVEGIPHIAIIRNPINRFFSASSWLKRMYGEDIQEAMEDPIMFSMMLNNFPLPEAVNWYRPQVDFISDKTYLWRFEDGFKEKFSEWISNILGVSFRIHDVPYEKLSYDESNRLERTDKLIDNIKSLYRKDIEQLYPELAA
tara:strand:- start:335 stop:937 length:603 start_codon:yes stop_codon:yes gene_type:complete